MAAEVRVAGRDHAEQIRRLATGNGMFAPEDMGGFNETLQGYLDAALQDHRWIVAESPDGQLDGAAYYAPEPFGDRVWNLFFIAVRPDRHGSGTGSLLLSHVEEELRSEGDGIARVLIVETSSGAAYAGARRFYESKGFDREATIREFYGPGDDKIVFWKSLTF